MLSWPISEKQKTESYTCLNINGLVQYCGISIDNVNNIQVLHWGICMFIYKLHTDRKYKDYVYGRC